MNHRQRVKKELDKFMDKYGDKIDTVIELGCGEKNFKKYFQDKGKGWVGLDITIIQDSAVMLGDFNNLPYHNDTFDLVFSCHSFEHTIVPIRALNEMRRITSKYIFIATPYPCQHQILDADADHLFCLTDLQMRRLFRFCGIRRLNVYYNIDRRKRKQDWDLISTGIKWQKKKN